MEIIYEPHPVTPERKAELLAAGYKIIDARFAPEPVDVPRPVAIEINVIEPAPVEKPKRGRKAMA
jgi:hypothetical protein